MIWFSDWMSLVRILIIGVFGYIGLILTLRISGTRTLSKMNSFDFVVTIAIGSTFATSILQKSVALIDVLFAFALLIGLQYIVTWATVRSTKFDNIIKSSPILLYSNDDFLKKPMKKAHVTKEEVKAAMREQGFSTMEQVEFVILETNGLIVAAGKTDKNKILQRSTF